MGLSSLVIESCPVLHKLGSPLTHDLSCQKSGGLLIFPSYSWMVTFLGTPSKQNELGTRPSHHSGPAFTERIQPRAAKQPEMNRIESIRSEQQPDVNAHAPLVLIFRPNLTASALPQQLPPRVGLTVPLRLGPLGQHWQVHGQQRQESTAKRWGTRR